MTLRHRTEAAVYVPDEKGELVGANVELLPGALIRVPKSQEEIEATLRGAGVKFNQAETLESSH